MAEQAGSPMPFPSFLIELFPFSQVFLLKAFLERHHRNHSILLPGSLSSTVQSPRSARRSRSLAVCSFGGFPRAAMGSFGAMGATLASTVQRTSGDGQRITDRFVG